MQQVTSENLELLLSDLKLSEELRSMNQEGFTKLLAENKLLKSIIVGISHKPIDQIMKDAEPIIRQEYEALLKRLDEVDKIIQKMGKA